MLVTEWAKTTVPPPATIAADPLGSTETPGSKSGSITLPLVGVGRSALAALAVLVTVLAPPVDAFTWTWKVTVIDVPDGSS